MPRQGVVRPVSFGQVAPRPRLEGDNGCPACTDETGEQYRLVSRQVSGQLKVVWPRLTSGTRRTPGVPPDAETRRSPEVPEEKTMVPSVPQLAPRTSAASQIV